ncbi:MAG TPA: deoxynucleoside kinase [bacterium]|mgnify:CR=1 FL=1|jgi:deoxyadenosine/deoxycytidine kinase|nr:deoxynucleoside kinase [Myxococcales bacterium]OQA62041.1 MAG: Deoxynucleoside kinase [bacterium ADurb.Bin270]HPW45215.1 deoxynucleoside kinase [bacterium]HQC50590.1 deoxynucleoside kinase [bacterium]HQG13054.1 deoxynucleoside kinase [bacterium]
MNFHIGIMGNLFSGKTTLMNALATEPYKSDLSGLLDDAEIHTFSERVDRGSLTDECLSLFYSDRVANIFPTETAFLHMRTLQQREIRHLMTRHKDRGVLIVEDRPFLDGPEVFVKRMIDSGEMPHAHAKLYKTLFYQTLHNERIRLPDLTVYLRSEPGLLEKRRMKRAEDGDSYAKTITEEYLREIHECYEQVATNWKKTLLRYQEYAIVPPDADIMILPAEIDMYDHPDYVHVAAGTIREKVRRMIAARRSGL